MVELADNGITIEAIHPREWYLANGNVHSLPDGRRCTVILEETIVRGFKSRDDSFDFGQFVTTFVTDMSDLFQGNERIAEADLGSWDVRGVISMEGMFRGARSFKGNGLEHWDVCSLRNAFYMFCRARVFCADISKWRFSPFGLKVVGMFYKAASFSCDLNGWADQDGGLYSWDKTSWEGCVGHLMIGSFRGCSSLRHAICWAMETPEIARDNAWEARRRVFLWRHAYSAHRDAKLCFFAARDKRPLELAKRLVLGRLAGGLDEAKRAKT